MMEIVKQFLVTLTLYLPSVVVISAAWNETQWKIKFQLITVPLERKNSKTMVATSVLDIPSVVVTAGAGKIKSTKYFIKKR